MKNEISIINLNIKIKIFIYIIIGFTILLCTLPMKLCPIYNGKIPQHRNQYELLADSILKGHLYIDYDVDDKLIDMENPYDPVERVKQKVNYHWDHSFYNGHYYMYFGVAPVFLTFIPYKLITGKTLLTYHATQIYVAGFIIGVFALFYLLCKLFYPKTRVSIYVLSSVIFSMISVWYSIGAPSLYCTAITSGLCMAIWSIYFFVLSVYGSKTENKSIIFAFLGSLFGALTFACRPPIGLVNFLVIPMLIHFIKNHKINKKIILKMIFAAMPYVIIGILLMIYNYVRFDSAFEFGQSYQLTVADQHNYSSFLSNVNVFELLSKLKANFFDCNEYLESFPYVNISGAFINFPILFFPLMTILNEKCFNNLKKKQLNFIYIILLILPILVTVIDSFWVPQLGERYRMDIYYLMIISSFISIVNYYEILDNSKKKIFNLIICLIFLCMFVKILLLFFVPNDSNFTQYYPNILEKIKHFLS